MGEMNRPQQHDMAIESWRALSPEHRFRLDGRTALVTGAGGGIGSWLAVGLAAAGARVVLTDKEPEHIQDLATMLQNGGAESKALPADLSDLDASQSLVRHVGETYGLDVLVNCAGINVRMPTAEVTPGVFDAILGINFKAPFFLSAAAFTHMAERGGGSIVHIGSINSFQGLPEVGVYGPTKAALEQLTKVQAIEWAQHNVRVNCLAPGFMDTPLTLPLQADPMRASWIADRVPLSRFGHPSELVGMLQLLASDVGSFITGQTFYVDGGFTAGSDWRKGGSGSGHE